MFDITQLATTDSGFLHLKSPATEEHIFVELGEVKVPVGIMLHAPGSPAYIAAENKRTNRALVRSKRKTDLTADMLRADQVEFLTDVTASFDNLGYPPAGEAKGEDLFKALYADRKFGWVVDQANAFLADWGNFSTASAKS